MALFVLLGAAFIIIVVEIMSERRATGATATMSDGDNDVVVFVQLAGWGNIRMHWCDTTLTVLDSSKQGRNRTELTHIGGIPQPYHVTFVADDLSTGEPRVLRTSRVSFAPDSPVQWSADGSAFELEGTEFNEIQPGAQFRLNAFTHNLAMASLNAMICTGIMLLFIWVITEPRIWISALNTVERCQHCGYNLHGIDSRRCPECGAARNGGPAERSVSDEADA